MIGFLRGHILEIELGKVLLDVGGVGYEVQLPETSILNLRLHEEANLYIRQIFREDGVTLCGFSNKDDRTLFDLLLDVKGCGPKVALALIGQLGTEVVTRSVVASDTRTLSKASGVGQRLAERIILEIRPKIESKSWTGSGAQPVAPATGNSDLIDALVQLGYRRSDAEKVAGDVNKDLSIDAKIRLGLQILKKI